MKTIFQFLKPYKILCIFTILVMILDVIGVLFIPTLVGDIINNGVENKNISYVIKKSIIMLLISLSSGAGTLLGSFLCASLSSKMGRDMRNALYDKSLHFSANDFEQFGTSSMITRTLNDVNVVQQAFIWSIQMILPVPAMCIIGGIMAFSIDIFMGSLMIIATGSVIIGAFFITRKASFIFEKLQNFLDCINVVLRENITGVRVVRAFNKEKYEENRMHRAFEDYAESAIKANRLFFALESLAFFIMNIVIVLIIWFAGERINLGKMGIGDITALTEYAIMILFYIIMAQMVIILLPRAKVCLNRISIVLDHKPQIIDGIQPKNKISTNDVFHFHNVDFHFNDADEATLKELNFTMRKGETTAIIGSTGSGKSTIAKLLLRLHDVSKGYISLYGQDIRDISQNQLKQSIAYVPQKAWLFSGTIADNLRYGNENASEEEMLHALKVAKADFVKELPMGLNSKVAQGGTNFSGGQKQRLSIARALMKKADLYIFDDSFSALDFKTDAELRHALSLEIKNSAVLIIAQRVNTIENAEQIIVLEDGKTVGIGKHKDLLANCSIYRDIANSQAKGGSINE